MINDMEKIYLAHRDMYSLIDNIIKRMYESLWRPTYVIGIERGGLYLSVTLSHYFNVPHFTINPKKYSRFLIDMYVEQECDIKCGGNVLICDDINDTGKTFLSIRNNNDYVPGSYRTCALLTNTTSEFDKLDFYGAEITKNPETHKPWIVFPWEYDEKELADLRVTSNG